MTKSIDFTTNQETIFEYTEDGRVSKTIGDISQTVDIDDNGNTSLVNYSFDGKQQTYEYEHDKDGRLKKIVFPNSDIAKISYDKLDRVIELTNPKVRDEIFYHQRGDHATSLVSSIYQHIAEGTQHSKTERRKYSYDNKGNITRVEDNCKLTARYRYDGLNRLIREDNRNFGKSFTYEYDGSGNIVYKGVYEFTLKDLSNGEILEYSYDGDRLTDFNGDTCGNYDAFGNPGIYRGVSYQWSCLRNLTQIGDDINFEYNTGGIRTKKTKGDIETKYYWSEGRLLAEKRALASSNLEQGDYFYDGEIYYTYSTKTDISYMYNANELASFTLAKNGQEETFYYRRNLQGDITHIYNTDGKLKAEYIYDAWGNHEIVVNEDNIADINPFRYRGYYYDTETGLYYLKSRYYDPETGRFVNADAIEILDTAKDHINGLNLYAYCFNNPVNDRDDSGMWSWKGFWKTVAMVAVATLVVAACVVTGGAVAIAIGATIAATTVVGTVAGGILSAVNGGDFWDGAANGAVVGFIAGVAAGAIIGGAALGPWNPVGAWLIGQGVSVLSNYAEVAISQAKSPGGASRIMDAMHANTSRILSGHTITPYGNVDGAKLTMNLYKTYQIFGALEKGIGLRFAFGSKGSTVISYLFAANEVRYLVGSIFNPPNKSRWILY